MEIDPRGPRFGAVITVVVLAVVLLTGTAWLLAAQTVVFAVGALAGLRYAPYGIVYRYLVRPRRGPPAHTEAEAPPRFSQGMGMVIAAAGVLCYALGGTVGGLIVGLVENLTARYVGVNYTDLIVLGLLLGTLIILPNGMFGGQRVRTI